MEFLTPTVINTTTQIAVTSGTVTASNLIKTDVRRQWVSDGANSDSTTASVTISFDQTTTISRIALRQTNAKAFNIFYNGVTANVFSLTGSAVTGTSQWTGNDQSDLYMRVSSAGVTSVTFDFKTTQVANSEKAVGYLLLADLLLEFPRIPSSKNYKPKIDARQAVHTLSDGGTRVSNIQKKHAFDITFRYITSSFRDSLKDIYDRDEPVNFVPFGTTTSWDALLAEVVWPGDFEFYEYSDDAQNAGFGGQIRLRETS